MYSLAKQYLLSFYSNSLALKGDCPQALRWSPKGQRTRYSVMLDVVPGVSGKRVLDFGCGKGDLLGYLRETDIETCYTGIDINPDLIALAREKYPGADFRVSDVEDEPLGEDFDLVFICGVFNNKVQGVEGVMRCVLKLLFSRAREALAVNALSSHAQDKSFELNYVSPEELRDFALQELSPHVRLREDYLRDDFTLYIYREHEDMP